MPAPLRQWVLTSPLELRARHRQLARYIRVVAWRTSVGFADAHNSQLDRRDTLVDRRCDGV